MKIQVINCGASPRMAYKLNEASDLLGVSVVTLRRAIDRGLIKPIRSFRHILVPASELQRFLETTTSGNLTIKGGA